MDRKRARTRIAPDGVLTQRIVLVQRDRSPCPLCGAHRFRDANRLYCSVCGHWWWRCRPRVLPKPDDTT